MITPVNSSSAIRGWWLKKELKPGPNMVSLLFALEQSRGEEEIERVLDRFWHWLEPKELDEIKRALATWISRVALHTRTRKKENADVNLLEVRTMLAERLKIRDKKLVKQSLEKGLEQGHAEIVRNMSKKGLEPKEICNLTGLNLAEVKKLLKAQG